MGNVFNAVGALVEGRQQANQLRDQAEIVQQDIDRAGMNRAIQGQQYSAREESIRRVVRSALGRQRAAIAQSGTGFGGSNLAIVKQSEAAGELDALNLRYQGQLERLGMDLDIANLHHNKSSLRKAAKVATRMRWFNAASAFFGGKSIGAAQPTAAPSTGSGVYGQGSLNNFGNNTSNFSSGVYSGGSNISGGNLSTGYGNMGGYTDLFGGG